MSTLTAARAARELATVTLERRNDRGETLGTVELDPEVFGRPVNVPLMHQVVTAQLAARRSGSHNTKTRAEVAGGGAKPYRQKGTGRARQGSIRSPQFSGGGVALGPKPRSYAQRTPRKMTRLALLSALSDRASEGRVCLVDRWSFEVPRTKEGLAALQALGLEGSVLVVLGPDDSVAERSFANLTRVDLVEAGQLNAYDVLVNDWIVFSDATLPGTVREVEAAPARKPAAKRAAGKPAAEAAEEEGSTSEETAPTTEAAPARKPAAKRAAGKPAAEEEGSTSEETAPTTEAAPARKPAAKRAAGKPAAEAVEEEGSTSEETAPTVEAAPARKPAAKRAAGKPAAEAAEEEGPASEGTDPAPRPGDEATEEQEEK